MGRLSYAVGQPRAAHVHAAQGRRGIAGKKRKYERYGISWPEASGQARGSVPGMSASSCSINKALVKKSLIGLIVFSYCPPFVF